MIYVLIGVRSDFSERWMMIKAEKLLLTFSLSKFIFGDLEKFMVA